MSDTAPLQSFANAVQKMDNPKHTRPMGRVMFKEGDEVFGTWVDHDGRTYFQEGKIIKNPVTGLWVQSPDGGITEIKRFYVLNLIKAAPEPVVPIPEEDDSVEEIMKGFLIAMGLEEKYQEWLKGQKAKAAESLPLSPKINYDKLKELISETPSGWHEDAKRRREERREGGKNQDSLQASSKTEGEAEAVEILKDLCSWKHWKETVGANSIYREKSAEAWQRANDFLNSLVKREGGNNQDSLQAPEN